MIDYEGFEARIRNCSSEKELLRIEDEICELVKKRPEVDSERLYSLIASRKKHLQDHTCDPWRLKKRKNL